ncbi:anti-sigma-I factor RsgI family protein [Mesobacillus sp.]|uniref:anti-sigma-I factor RsgI family protein n=1 Tax=Mesobacillus sp. TaxID=2675271 RepID=UPI0039F037E9
MKTRVLVSKIKHDEGKMIVFTENSEFQKLSIPEGSSPSPGEMIEIDLPEEGAESKQAYNKKPFFKIYHSNKKWISAAAMILLLVASMFYGKISETSAAAYVNLDMNSSIQLEVDENGIVQKMKGLDAEGENIVNSIKLDNKELYSIIQELVQRENSPDGNIEQDEVIVMVSLVHLDESMTPAINEEKLFELINRVLESKKISGYIVINPATKDQWQEAEESGYTMNEYMLKNHAQEHGVEISGNQLHGEHSAAEYMVKNKIPAKQIFPETSYKVNWGNSDSDHTNRTEAKPEEWNSDHQVQEKELHGSLPDKETHAGSEMEQKQPSQNTIIREEKVDKQNVESNQTEQKQIDHSQYQSPSTTQGEREMNDEKSGTEERHTMDSQDRDRKEHGK